MPLTFGIVSEPDPSSANKISPPIKWVGHLTCTATEPVICLKLFIMHQLCIEFCAYNVESGIGAFILLSEGFFVGGNGREICGVSCICPSENVWDRAIWNIVTNSGKVCLSEKYVKHEST